MALSDCSGSMAAALDNLSIKAHPCDDNVKPSLAVKRLSESIKYQEIRHAEISAAKCEVLALYNNRYSASQSFTRIRGLIKASAVDVFEGSLWDILYQ